MRCLTCFSPLQKMCAGPLPLFDTFALASILHLSSCSQFPNNYRKWKINHKCGNSETAIHIPTNKLILIFWQSLFHSCLAAAAFSLLHSTLSFLAFNIIFFWKNILIILFFGNLFVPVCPECGPWRRAAAWWRWRPRPHTRPPPPPWEKTEAKQKNIMF